VLINFFIFIQQISRSFTGRWVHLDHYPAETSGVRGEHKEANNQPYASRQLGGVSQPHPYDCAKQETKCGQQNIRKEIARASIWCMYPESPNNCRVHSHEA